jgi:hypothetical protein
MQNENLRKGGHGPGLQLKKDGSQLFRIDEAHTNPHTMYGIPSLSILHATEDHRKGGRYLNVLRGKAYVGP